MRFYLGTHEPSWLHRAGVPLFLSDRRLRRYRKWHRAAAPWALDSGGFTELSMHGQWLTEPQAYADRCSAYAEQIGMPDFCAVQDWMCEPQIREKTGQSIEAHQRLTIASFLQLREIAPGLPWLPVVQGWDLADYCKHVRLYESAGIDLTLQPVVGVGSVCRRQSSKEGQAIVAEVAAMQIRVHAFGFKTIGLMASWQKLTSSDSMAWSFTARRRGIRLEGCSHSTCANCLRYALQWRSDVLALLPSQLQLFA